MPAIGITGGVATGKSSFVKCLQQLMPAAKFFDADVAAREVVDLPEVKQELTGQFGDDIFSGSGHLNREALRAIVFADPAKKSALEQILHPRIRRQWSALGETHRNSSDFFFADIPLLYETNGEKLCDRVVVVACSRNVQLARLRQRSGIGFQPMADRQDADATMEAMINSQMPLKEKIRRADHVVWNNGTPETLMDQAAMLVSLWQTEWRSGAVAPPARPKA